MRIYKTLLSPLAPEHRDRPPHASESFSTRSRIFFTPGLSPSKKKCVHFGATYPCAEISLRIETYV